MGVEESPSMAAKGEEPEKRGSQVRGAIGEQMTGWPWPDLGEDPKVIAKTQES